MTNDDDAEKYKALTVEEQVEWLRKSSVHQEEMLQNDARFNELRKTYRDAANALEQREALEARAVVAEIAIQQFLVDVADWAKWNALQVNCRMIGRVLPIDLASAREIMRKAGEWDAFAAQNVKLHEAIALTIPAAAKQVAEWRENSELLEWYLRKPDTHHRKFVDFLGTGLTPREAIRAAKEGK